MRLLYIDSDPTQKSRATALGCGWMADVPQEFTAVASAPCVIGSGAGITVVVPEPTTLAAVTTAIQPIVTAEATAAAANAVLAANSETIIGKARTALTANATYLAIASPSTAQNTAQIKLLTREMNALIRLLLADFTSMSDT